MPVYFGLCCCDCGFFQVVSEKKTSNKWVCTLCRKKQSVLKVYAKSELAKEVRPIIQRLNRDKGEAKAAEAEAPPQAQPEIVVIERPAVSMWDRYLSSSSSNQYQEYDEDEPDELDGIPVLTTLDASFDKAVGAKKRKRPEATDSRRASSKPSTGRSISDNSAVKDPYDKIDYTEKEDIQQPSKRARAKPVPSTVDSRFNDQDFGDFGDEDGFSLGAGALAGEVVEEETM